MRILSPSRPRTTGRPALGPNWLLATPGRELSASPTFMAESRESSAGPMSSAGVSAETAAPMEEPFTVIVSIAFGVWASSGGTERAATSSERFRFRMTPEA